MRRTIEIEVPDGKKAVWKDNKIEIEVPDDKKVVWKDNKVVFKDIKSRLPKNVIYSNFLPDFTDASSMMDVSRV